MFRSAIVLFLVLPLTGSAAAIPVAVGPDGLAGPTDPYYVKVDVTVPEAPHSSSSTGDDCASSDRPTSPEDAATRVVAPLLGKISDPSSIHWLEGLTPSCVAGPDMCVVLIAQCLPYFTYDVETGQYYIEPQAGDPGITGTMGPAILVDCVGCPWP